MSKKFSVIVADPPWSFSDKLQHSDVARGAEANYHTMTISDIQSLDVKSICNPSGAVLCLWVPGSLLQEGLDTMKAWGFKHKRVYVWVKTKKSPLHNLANSYIKDARRFMKEKKFDSLFTSGMKMVLDVSIKGYSLRELLAFGMGRLFRQTHEICLIGISNNEVYKKLANKSRRSVCFAENLKHSAKPEDLQDSLEIMFPRTQKLEMFARRVRPGWTCLGDEIDGKDIRDALAELK